MEGYLAEVRMFAGNFAPVGWMFCQGQLVPIAQYDALFALLGTTYGGDGISTFALPNLSGRLPVGTGTGPGLPAVILGQMGGTPTTTLVTTQLPAHTHALTATASLSCKSGAGDADEPAGNVFAGSATDENFAAPAGGNGSMASANVSGTTGVSGGSQPFNNMQPCLGLHPIICVEGIFPSRN